jgi:alpha-beta hydrolase superfamily lysophospholipase
VVAVPLMVPVRRDRFALLLHGMGDDAAFPLWPWMEELARRGLVSISVDWDGHGRGGSSTLDFPRALDSIDALVAALASREEVPPRCCHLVGHSTGAALALAALCRPGAARQAVASMVAVSPALALARLSSAGRELLELVNPWRWRDTLLPLVPYYGVLGLLPAFGPFRRGTFPIRMARVGHYQDQLRGFVEQTFERQRVLRDLATPTVWIHGRQDHLVPYSRVSALFLEAAGIQAIEAPRGHLGTAFARSTAVTVADCVAS